MLWLLLVRLLRVLWCSACGVGAPSVRAHGSLASKEKERDPDIHDRRELMHPPVISSENDTFSVTLTFERAKVYLEDINVVISTRLYNGIMPGPTLRIKPGQTVTVKVRNALVAYDDDVKLASGDGFHNTRVTNIHTHGLFISGVDPADNVESEIKPGENDRDYVYAIPSVHSHGTHWYHPHYHGSSTLQVGGGAAGAILIEDPQRESLPSTIANLPERVIVFQHLDVDNLESIARNATPRDSYFSIKPIDSSKPIKRRSFFLVNGMYKPIVTFRAGGWYRLRMVNAGWDSAFKLTLDNCDVRLLSKDGVLLHEYPRDIEAIFLASRLAQRCARTMRKLWPSSSYRGAIKVCHGIVV